MVLVLVATAALIAALKLTVAGFGSIGQLTAILVTAIFLVVASFGQGLVILTGGIDLSIGAVMGILLDSPPDLRRRWRISRPSSRRCAAPG